jgi:hypothetical protein
MNKVSSIDSEIADYYILLLVFQVISQPIES